MNGKRLILILQIAVLLGAFGAITFHFQYTIRKSTQVVNEGGKKDVSKEIPTSDEETADSDGDGEEEEQDEDRAFHPSMVSALHCNPSVTRFSRSVLLDFKEIHFEIVTPPPQA